MKFPKILDMTKVYLGKLCKHSHEFEESGCSLRFKRNNTCVVCVSLQRKIFWDKNRGKLVKQKREYNKNNREKIAARQKIYYHENKVNILEKRLLNKHTAERARAYYVKHKDKILKAAKDKHEKLRKEQIFVELIQLQKELKEK